MPRPTAWSILFTMVLAVAAPRAVHAQDKAQDTTQTATQDTAQAAPHPLTQLLERITLAGHERDSLSKLADQTTGGENALLEEQVWQAQLKVQAGILDVTNEIERMKTQGSDLSAARAILQDALASAWPRYRRQLERRERIMRVLLERREGATPQERLEIETEFAANSERTAQMVRELVDALLAAEHVGIDVTVQRAFISEKLSRMAEQAKLRIVVLERSRALAADRIQRTPDDPGAQTELEVAGAALDQTMENLETTISLLSRLGVDVTDLKVSLIVSRGTLTSSIFEPGVLKGLFEYWRHQFVHVVQTRGPHWLFEGLIVVLIVAGFGLLAKLTRFLVRRAVASVGVSQLLKDTTVMWSSRVVFGIGLLVLLKQFGLQLGPMLAGLGIAGFALGFALQDTLSNFAAGAMILAYHPYDVGDIVEAGGAMGTVKHMSLVSTTILTFDNQTLIVPNKKMWGDVIRNITSQDKRRVDLLFAVGYENDLDTVERLLTEIAGADSRVLKNPAPVIKLDQLGDSLKFTVRVWTRQENYWDVYWDITRAVKLRFDQEKITFPQREVLVRQLPGGPNAESSPAGT
jgi:small conductance mechanosensitive channel